MTDIEIYQQLRLSTRPRCLSFIASNRNAGANRRDLRFMTTAASAILANALAVLTVLTGPTYAWRQSAPLSMLLPVVLRARRFSDRMPPSGYNRVFHDPFTA